MIISMCAAVKGVHAFFTNLVTASLRAPIVLLEFGRFADSIVSRRKRAHVLLLPSSVPQMLLLSRHDDCIQLHGVQHTARKLRVCGCMQAVVYDEDFEENDVISLISDQEYSLH